MAEKIDTKYFDPGTTAFNYNVTGSAESASGGSGGSGMECLQPRSPPPGPFHYLISEQAKSLVVLQELQNEVGALLDFRDLVIETFPNLRSKMSPSTPSSSVRREWEPGVRVRRKLAGNGDSSRTKPQPSVQDSGFSTETSCGKDNHSSAASTGRSRPIEDELWALLDVIQRKGVRLREEAESLRGELDERNNRESVEESFARILNTSQCEHRASNAEVPAVVKTSPSTPLGRLDRVLDTPSRHPTIPTPDNKKFAAVLQESNPVELQRHLLTSIVQKQILSEKLRKTEERKSVLLEKLERAQDLNDDLKFQLEEKTIELEGARAIVRQLESRSMRAEHRSRERDSMRDLEPLTIPESRCSDEEVISSTPRRTRPSRIPRARVAQRSPARPASAQSSASQRSASRLPSARKSTRRSTPAPVETKPSHVRRSLPASRPSRR